MTLTREAFAEKCKPRFEVVEVDGFGPVGLRAVPELQRSRRVSRLFDGNGEFVASSRELRRIHSIIDQVTDEEGTPMFTDTPADVEFLSSLDGAKLDPLIAAIQRFNGDDEKKESAESSDGEPS